MAGNALFGPWLKQRRKLLDLTQEVLARQIGCAAITLRKIEADEIRPSKQLAEKLVEFLDIPPQERTSFLLMARGLATPGSAYASVGLTQPSHNLLVPATGLVGRENDLVITFSLLRREEVRLLTLSGPPGIGKTRLSLQIGQGLLDLFADGVFFVNLAPISDPALVAATIAQTLGVKESGTQPVQDTLKNFLRFQQMLLILDNFEQVVDAALLVAELLTVAPLLKVLVTSREVLHLSGEHEYQVPPLGLPDLEHLPPVEALAQYPAVQLFVQRAQAVYQDFNLNRANAPAVAALCVKLDGLPLAIELAAARSKLFGARALLAHLTARLALPGVSPRDLPPRHRTIHGAIEWSYQLLEPTEQRLYCHLGIFVSGWTLEAAKALANLSPETPGETGREVLDGLVSLVDKSLVRLGGLERMEVEPRYTMLETIREFALERLASRGERAELNRQHAAYFIGLAEAAWQEIKGPRQQAWLDRLEEEHANLRAALDWLVEQEDFERGLQLAGSLWIFWTLRGYLTEGRKRLAGFMALAKGQVMPRTAWLARAFNGAGHLALDQGDYGAAGPLIEESLAIWQELGNKAEMAWALYGLALVSEGSANYSAARSLFEQSLLLADQSGDRRGKARALIDFGNMAMLEGDYAAAHSYNRESQAIFQELGDKQGLGWALLGLGYGALVQGDLQAASALLEEGLVIFNELGFKWGSAMFLFNKGLLERNQGHLVEARTLAEQSQLIIHRLDTGLRFGNITAVLLGLIAHDQGNLSEARQLLEEGLSSVRETNNKQLAAICLPCLGQVVCDQGDFNLATRYLTEALIINQELGAKPFIALAMEGLAQVAIEQGQAERAARLYGTAEALREALGYPLPPVDQPRYDRRVATIRLKLGQEAFEVARTEGRAMRLDEAIRYSLEEPF